jgi:hypothetical protein
MTELRITGLASGIVGWRELGDIADEAEAAGGLSDGVVGAAVPVASVVERFPIDPSATHCSVVSRDSSYSASIPVDELLSGGWLAYALDGKPLPAEKGGPFRLTVRQGTTLCWNVKDVGELRFTAGKEPDSIPERPTH